ncbi:alpha/beta hydrolase [Microscilla marina]|uniref:Putative acetyl-hydrolase n=1 Tax=Microscilla marina ATCC 23134 TaxID=313606 RepID=A1ZUX5_MICM2|nr:alpha/beta hydrolase [Microscilla marina]EAY25879.1 putative acetyl-hydrolase [Microscilla marina ATCC 23134]
MISEKVIRNLRSNLIKQCSQHICDIPVTIEKEMFGEVPCYWVKTAQTTTDQVIFYLHGGSNVMGSIKSHKNVVTRIAHQVGIQALFVEFSLAPEYPFPKGFQDILQVYKELLNKYSSKDIIVMGDSAGGQQGLALLLKLKDERVSLPMAYVGLSPAVDITSGTLKDNIERIKGQDPIIADIDEIISLLKLYYTHHSPSNPLISPFYGDLTGLPPMLIQVSTTEALVFQCEDFVDKAKASGVNVTLEKYEGELHTWQFYNPNTLSSQKSFKNIASFIQKHIRPIFST